MKHISVFKKEVIESFDYQPDGVFLDLTLGAAGHSRAMLSQMKHGTLICFDLDTKALASFANKEAVSEIEQLEIDNNKVILVNRNFSELESTLKEFRIKEVNGILADLGWSSDQLDSIPGLSYHGDQPLDMRLDTNLKVDAKDILNLSSEQKLKSIFEDNADIFGKLNTSLVKLIIKQRGKKQFENTSDLTKLLSELHAATQSSNAGNLPARVFQALRIAVNTELSTLQSLLPQALDALITGGCLQVITFHSGEELVVKGAIDGWITARKAEYKYGKPFLQPSVAELRQNIRAHSAKLWVITKK